MKSTKKILLLCGLCVLFAATIIIVVLAISQNTVSDSEFVELNDTQINEYLEQNVYSQWSRSKREPEYKTFCSHYVLGSDDSHIYLYSAGTDACYKNNTVKITNGAQTPVALNIKRNGDKVKITGYSCPEESAYTESLKRIFPEEFIDKISALTNDDRKALSEDAEKRACEYFKTE
ncbi:MAG: hypothetical protein HDT42_11635 [Ruminococcaceae bacterium]|nr:hypothetical protein [Oscillospiraceae bacterium]